MLDLHIHSECSIDAVDSPESIIEHARDIGITAISLTEHENIGSLERARRKAEALGIRYINGIEVGIEKFPVGDLVLPVHMLGYGFSSDAAHIRQLTDDVRARGAERTKACLEGLGLLSIPVTEADVRDFAPGRVSLWAIRRLLCAKGLASGKPEATEMQERALAAAASLDARHLLKPALTVPKTLAALKADGATTIMAHPFWTTKPSRGGHDHATVWQQIEALLAMGVDGLEASNTANDAGCADSVLEFCKERNLPATGGSDSHGMALIDARPCSLSLLDSLQRFRAGKPPWRRHAGRPSA